MDTNFTKEKPEKITNENKKEEEEEEEEVEKENELKRENLYLLDSQLFFKYQHLIQNKSNFDYLKKINEKSLLYGKRFYPISFEQLELIKLSILKNQTKQEEKIIDDINIQEINDEKINENIKNDNIIRNTANDNKDKDNNDNDNNSNDNNENKNVNVNEKINKQNGLTLDSFSIKNPIKTKEKRFIWKPLNWTCFSTANKKKKKKDE